MRHHGELCVGPHFRYIRSGEIRPVLSSDSRTARARAFLGRTAWEVDAARGLLHSRSPAPDGICGGRIGTELPEFRPLCLYGRVLLGRHFYYAWLFPR